MSEPLDLLARDDKWQLGSGDGIIFAPSFPIWLDHPGFWDEATIYQYAFAPLYSVAVLGADGRELPLRTTGRRWTPAELVVEYHLPHGMSATETRTVQPDGVFVSEWSIRSRAPVPLHVIAWTAQDAPSIDPESLGWDGALAFARTVLDRRRVPLRVAAALTCIEGVSSWSASLSERSAVQPHWRFTPFADQWQGALPPGVRMDGINRDGLLYAAVHRAISTGAEGIGVTFAMRLGPADPDLSRRSNPARPSRGLATSAPSASPGTLAAASRRRWSHLFAAAPRFRCSDPYLETYYWYRWYGLFLNAIAPGVGNYRYPAMCEGPGFFHQPITYSAQCHVRELRWLGDPSHARGVFRTFFAHQKPDGSLHGRIYVNHLDGTDFYHADWGAALLSLDALAPDDGFLAELAGPLSRYAEWLVETRDREESGIFDVVDQYETGQEYMSRYQAVDPQADAYGWENRIRLKGIDVTVYAYSLLRTLERLSRRVGQSTAEARWAALADRTRTAVRESMWDPDAGMFFDVDPRSGSRTGVRAAVCFYPYATDIATAAHRDGLERNLLDPSRFWTTYPVPSSSLDDPLFDANAEWKGKRHLCPWNGRVWPMTNSHTVEALARQATPDAPHLREATAHLLRRFVHMMFHDGDLRRPNSYEHYNPFSAAASVYRGIDDYQHSWVNDLIMQYVIGLRPHDGGVTVDPFPFALEHAEVTGATVRGRQLSVRIEGNAFEVRLGEEHHAGTLGTPLELAW